MSEEAKPSRDDNCIRQFIQKEWKYMIGVALVLALLVFGYVEYQHWKQHIINQSQERHPSGNECYNNWRSG